MRNDAWLTDTMYELWENHFVDVPRKNIVLIKFGRKSRNQLGCITWASNTAKGIRKLRSIIPDNKEAARISLITITRFFQDEEIPDFVVIATIAHEMCHYAHGFHSPLKQLYDHPHKGGVIFKEMQKRDLGKLYKEARKWLRTNWRNYLTANI
ncbi:MAG TPA: hypothetical protein VJC17_02720 [Candidatus Dojkabacteria bacterium]|nr:hypothetical protein [Candidatus Dojkabacteria bacterium]